MRNDVLRLLDGDDARTGAVSMLLMRESWPFGSGQGGLGIDDVGATDVNVTIPLPEMVWTGVALINSCAARAWPGEGVPVAGGFTTVYVAAVVPNVFSFSTCVSTGRRVSHPIVPN